MKAYRFIDFANIARIDLKRYENIDLKYNKLYNFYMTISSPSSTVSHSTTMTLLFKITSGEEIPISNNKIINVKVIDADGKYIENYYMKKIYNGFEVSNDLTFKNFKYVNSMFKFEKNEIAKLFNGNELTIIKRDYEMYVNLSNKRLIPTDEWRCRLYKHNNLQHSIAYIANRDYYYKFPCNGSDEYIKFAVCFTDEFCYHKCLTDINTAMKMTHLDKLSCAIKVDHTEMLKNIQYAEFIKLNYINYDSENLKLDSLVEQQIKIRTIQHFDIGDETKMLIDVDVFQNYEIRKLWMRQLRNRIDFNKSNILHSDELNKLIIN